MRAVRRLVFAGLGVALCAAPACVEDGSSTRERILDTHRRHAYDRCLSARALDNYTKQCELAGGTLELRRRTWVCFDGDDNANPQGMGDGPHCVCHERDEAGVCIGETDCSAGIEEACAPLLTAEVVGGRRGEDSP